MEEVVSTGSVEHLRELVHDFDNQLTVVLALLQMGRVQRAVDYLRAMARRRPPEESDGIETLFAFLGEKCLEAVQRRIAVACDLTPCQLPHVPIDVLTRIVGNLFDNAVEAASRAVGGGKVKVTMRDWQTRWSLEIWNNGESIPPGLINRIFESGVTTKAGAQGRGLGLAVVRRFVDAYQGTIRVTSDPYLGTTFRLWFSLTPAYSNFIHNR